MKRRVFFSLLVAVLLVGALMVLLVSQALPAAAARRTMESLSREAALFRQKLPQEGVVAFLENCVTVSRITLIDPDGSVRYDNMGDAAAMEDHQSRPEIKQAQLKGTGSAQRFSETMGYPSAYYAIRLADGSVLRLSSPVRTGKVLFEDVLPWLLLGVALASVLCVFIAGRVTRGITRVIAGIDLDRPEDAVAYEELNPLLLRIDQQNKKSREQLQALQVQQQEMDALLNGMSEGFIALDQQRRVRTINRSAAKLLEVTVEGAQGRGITELYRRPQLHTFLEELQQMGAAQAILPWENRSYQWVANTLESEQSVIILRDITQRVEDDNMRKRFTANVSHELRTPLTSICGYSEMMLHGMARPEDQNEFLQRISAEGKRLLQLIEDILELSKLDEGYPRGRWDQVDLRDIVTRTLEIMEPLANAREVSLSFKGGSSPVMGDETLLGELVSNLLDNAIKYNRTGGKVEATLQHDRSGTILTVSDTGIGIERSQQDKIFERFFRTDKSRSKQTGGTGLGLSIVKHSAEYHQATLQLDSQPGQGTTITVQFPSVDRAKRPTESS